MREKDKEILRELISSVSKIGDNKVEKIIEICDEKYLNLGSVIKDKNIDFLPIKIKKIFNVLDELFLNILYYKTFDNEVKVLNCNDLIDYLKYSFIDKEKEIFKLIFFNTQCRIIKEEDMFLGTIDRTVVYLREVVKMSLKYNAKSIILVHNHPGGSKLPSKKDLETTKNLIDILAYVDVKVSDHIIICGNEYYSFLENGDI